jgi:hypothetical protein
MKGQVEADALPPWVIYAIVGAVGIFVLAMIALRAFKMI